MSSRRASARDALQSIEDMATEDNVEMRDAEEDSNTSRGVAASDASDDDEDETDMYGIIRKLTTFLCSVEEDGEEIASGFQRIPNRRVLPDYFDVISDPIAFSTIRGKTQKRQYQNFGEFVRDVAQICHNAQVYNRPSAPIFGAAVRLRELFVEELQNLAQKGEIPSEEAKIPDLGELPPVDESASLVSEDDADDADDDDAEEDEEDEDDDEEDEDVSDDDAGRRQRSRRLGRPSIKDQDEDRDEEAHKKRGRPPMVLTPMEARISSILRGIRKFKDEEGSLLILPFEKLPDKSAMADYYQTIPNPIALDNIKKKAKRKKYQNVTELLKDIDLMFENAKLYNEDDSPLYQAAVELQVQARALAEQEMAKPDDDFRDEDGKLPLAEVQHNGQTWRVGDWAHIRNANDLAKPIVAQIFRIWQDPEGQQWINACWYYRPEQTVHRFEKHFFEHEVVKTGQYRDHQIGEVLDRCFVMFVTRFNKGRPRGFPPDKDVYVCESRYNEDNFRFNKIKTWASCVPDEVRERDYEMDLFEVPRRMRKVPSPIKHLLREDAKETDELPRPTWGSPNAPPIVGAVHRRPRLPNESPPPEPTPPPATAVPESMNQHNSHSSMSQASAVHGIDFAAGGMQPGFMGQGPSPSPNQYNTQGLPHSQPTHQQMATPQLHQGIAPPGPNRPMQYQQQQASPQNYTPMHPQSATPFMQQSMAMGYNQPVSGRPQHNAGAPPGPGHGNVYNPPRPPEVYTLPDNINEALNPQIRHNFQHDRAGRVLFFAGPPLDRPYKGLSEQSAKMGHSIKYFAGRNEWLAGREKKRKARDQQLERTSKRAATGMVTSSNSDDLMVAQAPEAMAIWLQRLTQGTPGWGREAGLSG